MSKAFRFQKYDHLATVLNSDGIWKIRPIEDKFEPLCVRYGEF